MRLFGIFSSSRSRLDYLMQRVGLLTGLTLGPYLFAVLAFTSALLGQLRLIETVAFKYHPKFVLDRPLISLLTFGPHYSGQFAPSIHGGIGITGPLHEFRHSPVQRRHHLPHTQSRCSIE